MENSELNKEKFFAQYWGQEVLNVFMNGGAFARVPLKRKIWPYDEKDHLVLKSVKNISDEDAYGVGIKVNCWSPSERRMDFFKDDEMKDVHISAGKNFASSIGTEFGWGMSHPFANNVTDILNAYDFLRMKGYALPFMGIKVEQLIKYGWLVLEDN